MRATLRTTIRLEDSLLEQAKREAARRGGTVTALIEEGLRVILASSKTPHEPRRVKLPVCRAGGGTLPGIDLNDSSDLLDRMENR
jgi:hypothetical protein